MCFILKYVSWKLQLESLNMNHKLLNWTLTAHVLPIISRCKSNQTMKFGQLIENNMRNIFLEKSNTKCGGENSPRFFSKKITIEHIPGLTVWSFVFIACPSWGLSKSAETKVQTICFYLI